MVFVAVDKPGYEIDFPSDADVEIHGLYRAQAAHSENWIAEAIAETAFLDATFDVFVHGVPVRAVNREPGRSTETRFTADE